MKTGRAGGYERPGTLDRVAIVRRRRRGVAALHAHAFPARKSIAGITRIGSAPDPVATALFDRHVRSGRGSIVRRLRADQPVVGELLEDVSRPSGDPAAGEQTGELVARNPQIG